MREISFIIIWLKKKLFCLCIHSTLVGHPLGKILIYSNIPETCYIVQIVVLRLAFKMGDIWSDEDDQLTEPIDNSRVELTSVLIVSTWALLQPIASANGKYENNLKLIFT